MEAIVRACRAPDSPAQVVGVVASQTPGKPESPALARAAALGVPIRSVPYGDHFGERLIQALGPAEYLCLAGFLRLVPPEVLAHFQGRVLNIHPALLPRHGGKGMFGQHVHAAVLRAGETESGCTVHWVTEAYDEGAVILQLACPVDPADTPETLAARVLELEHRAYPQALFQVIRERSTP
jgi:folate-dependent phosphoribosylglycinamide formyltransferase PurN